MSTERFHEIVLPLKDKLYRHALSIIRDRSEAEDIIQDVLLKLWDKKKELSQIENLEAYCYRATRNLTLDRLSMKSFRKTETLDMKSFELTETTTPQTLFENKETASIIEQCIDELSETQKSVFQLREMEGMSYKEIAETLDLSQDIVKVSLFRARNNIKSALLKKDSFIKENKYGKRTNR
ncbi:MAG TPA: sigma-70 family RNA polymerase sigma factor [Dysgonamonadaceae bacterium]|jgi:RNA polymerase sigma-70 factor (ECF subfamily)|nr:sigma-70 family RNA polymerase sigma factor [Dysgonamonadaceae bacterium]